MAYEGVRYGSKKGGQYDKPPESRGGRAILPKDTSDWFVPSKRQMGGAMDVIFGTGADIMTQTVVDPIKEDLASPLSRYLQSEVGKGLPRYRGRLAGEPTEEESSVYNRFLAKDPGEWYDEYVEKPTREEFMEESLPVIREGYAGSLRGSGRYGAEEAGLVGLSKALAGGRAKAQMDIPKQQWNMAMDRMQRADIAYERQYKDWMKSLPQANPALEQALKFLQEGTSTGRTVLTATDPGSEGILGGILGMFAGS